MTVKVLREEIVDLAGTEYFEVETWGELKYMPKNAKSVRAIFGNFERTDQSTLLYSSYVLDDWQAVYESKQDLIGSMDSEYLDDLRALREGRVGITERR